MAVRQGFNTEWHRWQPNLQFCENLLMRTCMNLSDLLPCSTTEINLIKEWIGCILKDPWRKSGWDVKRKNAVADRGGWAPTSFQGFSPTGRSTSSSQFSSRIFFAFYFSTSKTGNSYASVIVVVRGRFKFILLHTIYRSWWIEGVMNVTKVIFWIFQVLQVVFGQLFGTMITLSNWPSPIKLLHWPLPFAFPTIYQS